MIDKIKTLLNKTNELEDKINSLSNNQNNSYNTNNFVCFSKGQLNLSFANSNKILLAEFETIENFPLYFQNQIELNIPTSQTIKISLSINKITFFRSTRKLQAGYNQFTIMKSFTPLKNERVELYLQITTENDSPITILSNTLFVWGLCNHSNEIQYQVLETNDNFYLSYLNNNTLYFSKIEKTETELNSEDFTFYSSAIGYSFAFLKSTNKVYLFRIDLDGNLFFTDIEDNNETFIDSNVTHISTCSSDDCIKISIIKNYNCYAFEMNENEIFSNHAMVDSNDILIYKSYLYWNKYNNNFYLILTDKNNSNYLTKSIPEYQSNNHFINAEYSIEFEEYEVGWWN